MKLRISSDYRIGPGIRLVAKYFLSYLDGPNSVEYACTLCEFKAVRRRPKWPAGLWKPKAKSRLRHDALWHVTAEHADVLGKVVRESRGHIVEAE